MLLGSHFTLTRGADGSGGSLALWGRGARSSFSGSQDELGLDGELVTGMVGADYARGDWLFGLTLSRSRGEGGYRGAAAQADGPGMAGLVESSLTSAVPWAAWRPSERLEFWGAAGCGAGDVTLRPGARGPMPALAGMGLADPTGAPMTPVVAADGAGEVLTADTAWTMAAAGLRAELFGRPGGGPALAVVSDALWTGTESERIPGLAASSGAVSRLRLGLEGGLEFDLGKPGRLTPRLELGARHDGGDAETGFGVEVGGGVAWEAPALGLRLDLEGRTLVSHEDGGFEDSGFSASFSYDPTPATQQGLTFGLRQDVGDASSGGLDAMFNRDRYPRGSGYGAYGTPGARWTAEAAYGMPAFGARFVGGPAVGIGTSAFGRDYSVGWRLVPVPGANGPDLALGLLLIRRENHAEPPAHGFGIELRARF